MLTRVLSRLLSATLILFAVFALTRAMVRALPGDPTDTLVAETGTSIPRDEIRHEMGLDRPFYQALIDDSISFAQGDWGKSFFSKQPIAPLIRSRFVNTLKLSLTALALALSVSLIVGLFAASRHESFADRFCTGYGALAAALPIPWIGPILIVVFALWIRILPLGGSIVLPAVTLALGISGYWSRLLRNRVRDSLALGSAPGARARGIPEWRIVLKYGLAPVSGPLLGYLGTQVGALLAGTFVTEVIFNWRGMGSLWVSAVLRRDYPVIEAATFVGAAMTLLGIILGDWAMSAVIRREEKLR